MSTKDQDYHVSDLERNSFYKNERNRRNDEQLSMRNVIMHISDINKDKTSENITALISPLSRDAPIPELPPSDSTLAAFHAVSQYAFFAYRTGFHNIAQAYNITRENANKLLTKIGDREKPFDVTNDQATQLLRSFMFSFKLLVNNGFVEDILGNRLNPERNDRPVQNVPEPAPGNYNAVNGNILNFDVIGTAPVNDDMDLVNDPIAVDDAPNGLIFRETHFGSLWFKAFFKTILLNGHLPPHEITRALFVNRLMQRNPDLEYILGYEYLYGTYAKMMFTWFSSIQTEVVEFSDVADSDLVLEFASFLDVLLTKTSTNFVDIYNYMSTGKRTTDLNDKKVKWKEILENVALSERGKRGRDSIMEVVRKIAAILRNLKRMFVEMKIQHNRLCLLHGVDLICSNLSTSMYFLSSFLTNLIIPSSLHIIGFPGRPEVFHSASLFKQNYGPSKSCIMNFDYEYSRDPARIEDEKTKRVRNAFTDAGISKFWKSEVDIIKRGLITTSIILDEVIDHFKATKNMFVKFDQVYKNGDDPMTFLTDMYSMSLSAIPRLRGVTHSSLRNLMQRQVFYSNGETTISSAATNQFQSNLSLHELAKNSFVYNNEQLQKLSGILPDTFMPLPSTKFITLFQMLPKKKTVGEVVSVSHNIFVSWHRFDIEHGQAKIWAAVQESGGVIANAFPVFDADTVNESRDFYNTGGAGQPDMFTGVIYKEGILIEPRPFDKVIFLKPKFSVGFKGYKENNEFFAANVSDFESYYKLFEDEVSELIGREPDNTTRMTATEATYVARDNIIRRGLVQEL